MAPRIPYCVGSTLSGYNEKRFFIPSGHECSPTGRKGEGTFHLVFGAHSGEPGESQKTFEADSHIDHGGGQKRLRFRQDIHLLAINRSDPGIHA